MSQEYRAYRQYTHTERPRIAVVLGSGLVNALRTLQVSRQIAFNDIPGLPIPSVAGHTGKLLLGRLAGVSVLVMQGRIHYYEGHDWSTVARPIEVLAELGVRVVLFTNAAGGIREDLVPGSLMTIVGHQRWNQPNFWRGGQVQTVQTVYARELLGSLPTQQGVYVSVTGPSYETVAEVLAMQRNGGDAVGMSTAHEAEIAHQLDLRVAGLSCITNRAAGLGQAALSHRDVTAIGEQTAQQVATVVEKFLRSVDP